MAATIKPIEGKTVHQIQSGQVIVDLCSVVKELVENSIDAGSSSIDVRFKNQGLDFIEVQDNGSGISRANHASIALKHYTSKLSTFSDIASLESFGFRGEALSSLCALSHLVLITCVQADVPRGSRLSFDSSGALKENVVVASSRGTTVSVTGLFHNLPVRRRELERNIKREWHKVCVLLNQYACIQTNVKFSVSQQPSRGNRMVLFSTRGNPTTRENIVNIFGARIMSVLVPVDLSLDLQKATSKLDSTAVANRDSTSCQIRLIGYISRPSPGDGRNTPDRQMLFVNGRPCGLPQVTKIFNEVYRTYNCSQSPFIFVDVRLDAHRYDVNVSPDKLDILLHDQNQLLKSIRTSLDDLFNSYEGNVPVSRPKDGGHCTGRDGTTFEAKESPFIGSNEVPVTMHDNLPLSDETTLACLSDPDLNLEGELRQNSEGDARNIVFVQEGKDSPVSQRLGKSWSDARKPQSLDSDVIEWQAGRGSNFNSARPVKPALRATKIGPSTPVGAESTRDQLSVSKSSNGPKERLMRDSALNADLHLLNCTAYNQTKNTFNESGKESHPPAVDLFNPKKYDNEQPITRSQPSTLVTPVAKEKEDVTSDEKSMPVQAVSMGVADLIGHNFKEHPHNFLYPQGASGFAAPRTNCVDSALKTKSRDTSGDEIISRDGMDGPVLTSSNGAENRNANVARDTVIHPGFVEKSKSLDDSIRRGGPMPGATQRTQADEEYVQSRMKYYISNRWQEKDEGPTLDAAEEEKALDAESQLTITIARDHFSRMRIVGQFNKGFIITVRPAALRNSVDSRASHDELFIIDQHASDEKYNFERLQTGTIVQSQTLVLPKSLQLTALEEEIVSENMAAIEANGFKVGIHTSDACSAGSRCQLQALPMSRDTTFGLGDLEELITLLGDEPSESGHIPRPSKVRKMFAMRACRGSVMIGQALTPNQMVTLVRQMGELDKPWNCPHGRPTMRHLCRLKAWESKYWNADTAACLSSAWVSFMRG